MTYQPGETQLWKDGQLWMFPKLKFTKEQWILLSTVFDTVRKISDDEKMSDSQCIEMIAADFAASYGVLSNIGKNTDEDFNDS